RTQSSMYSRSSQADICFIRSRISLCFCSSILPLSSSAVLGLPSLLGSGVGAKDGCRPGCPSSAVLLRDEAEQCSGASAALCVSWAVFFDCRVDGEMFASYGGKIFENSPQLVDSRQLQHYAPFKLHCLDDSFAEKRFSEKW